MKTFGYEAFVHIDRENITKLEEKSKKCTFIGYGVNDFGYCIWVMKITKSLGVEVQYSMISSCTIICCRERNKKRKTQNA